jgi:hypothetical protein
VEDEVAHLVQVTLLPRHRRVGRLARSEPETQEWTSSTMMHSGALLRK